jgi:hypothetical protein
LFQGIKSSRFLAGVAKAAMTVALTKIFLHGELIFCSGRTMMCLGQCFRERIMKLPIITASVVAYAALATALICYTGLATN